MIELELSLTWGLPDALADALRAFETKQRIRVYVQILDSLQERAQLANYGIFHTGPDVSEVGSTWLSSLIPLDALRPFAPRQVYELGGERAFFAPIWQAGVIEGIVVAVPWRTDTRVIYYRRDLLRQAGIDEQTAFATADDMQHTLDRLRTLPDVIPCAIPTSRHPMLLHVLAPWVWQAGGTFMRRDGRKTRFAHPETLAGIVSYFETFAPALTPAVQGRTDSEISNMFAAGQVAVTISGHWILDSIRRQRDTAPEVAANLGMALTPGAQYVGGMHLVIWDHTGHHEQALTLVRFLTQPEFQHTQLQQVGYLPARQDALDSPPFTTDPHYRLIGESLRSGRGFNVTYMWGLVEDRLTTVMHELWYQVFADPHIDLSAAVNDRLKPMAERLDRTLAGSRQL